MKEINLIILMGLISIFLVACSDAEVAPTDTEKVSVEEIEVEKEELSIEDSIDFEGMIITLNSARI